MKKSFAVAGSPKLLKSNSDLSKIYEQLQPQKKLLWSWRDTKQKSFQQQGRTRGLTMNPNQREAAEEEAKD